MLTDFPAGAVRRTDRRAGRRADLRPPALPDATHPAAHVTSTTARDEFPQFTVYWRAQLHIVRTDRCMTDTTQHHAPLPTAEILDAYGLVDAKGLALMIGLSHRTVMVYAAEAAWRTGHLPPPVYIGRAVRTRNGRGRRWRRATVRAWVAAAAAEFRGEVA